VGRVETYLGLGRDKNLPWLAQLLSQNPTRWHP
jgi:hypothetical protein